MSHRGHFAAEVGLSSRKGHGHAACFVRGYGNDQHDRADSRPHSQPRLKMPPVKLSLVDASADTAPRGAGTRVVDAMDPDLPVSDVRPTRGTTRVPGPGVRIADS